MRLHLPDDEAKFCFCSVCVYSRRPIIFRSKKLLNRSPSDPGQAEKQSRPSKFGTLTATQCAIGIFNYPGLRHVRQACRCFPKQVSQGGGALARSVSGRRRNDLQWLGQGEQRTMALSRADSNMQGSRAMRESRAWISQGLDAGVACHAGLKRDLHRLPRTIQSGRAWSTGAASSPASMARSISSELNRFRIAAKERCARGRGRYVGCSVDQPPPPTV